MKELKLIIRYFKVGRLLHLVATLGFSITVISFIKLKNNNLYLDDYSWFIWLTISIIFFSMSILAELDGYSRFQNYKQVKDQMFLNGYQERQLKPLLKSNCQREAVLLAANELGYAKEVRFYFHRKGYRWYHIIPDFVIKNPLFFFSAFFWRTTFFTPRYEPKVNYDQLELSQV
ncbi:MAG: hypothetical protein OQJ74_01470 [Ignavibacteriaceae bacterium]|jgi:hypothetical protein|nr:hypothetical protein [Ignavibacteriaceae bacterium]